ncbi:MAG: hypothetical protein AAGI52_06605 [Bacteroidota bacterium]
MKTIHLFRAGRQTDIQGTELAFSEDVLAGIASTYDPTAHEAPLVVGHPQTNGPAWGWISTLSADGSDLHGTPTQVDAAFAEQVGAGRFKKVSISLYLPGSSSHPLGADAEFPYLRHVGFLGAQPPAVKGLRAVEFGEDEEGVATVEFCESCIDPGDLPDLPPDPDPTMSDRPTPEEREAKLAEREAKLKEREQAAEKREADFAERNRQAQHAAHVAFAEGLADDGARILPRHVPVVTAVLNRLANPEAAEVVSFGEGEDDLPLVEALQRMLSELPQNVEYAEVSAADRGAAPVVAVTAPAGYTADPERAALHKRIVAYAEEHDLEYAVAAQRLGA